MPPAKKTPAKKPADDSCSIMEVAELTRVRYQKARDLMLSGAFGDATRRSRDNKLCVARAKVIAWRDEQKVLARQKAAP